MVLFSLLQDVAVFHSPERLIPWEFYESKKYFAMMTMSERTESQMFSQVCEKQFACLQAELRSDFY